MMVVLLAGGGGLLLLNEAHPPSANGSSRTTTGIRRIMRASFESLGNLQPGHSRAPSRLRRPSPAPTMA
jgi:hypothetical protein